MKKLADVSNLIKRIVEEMDLTPWGRIHLRLAMIEFSLRRIDTGQDVNEEYLRRLALGIISLEGEQEDEPKC